MTLRQNRPTNRTRAKSISYPAMLYDRIVSPGDERTFAYCKSGTLYWIEPISGAWRWLGDKKSMAA